MIIIDEYKVKLKQIKAEIDDLHGSMGIDNARKRLSEIEEITAAPDFWNDAANSHHILKEQKAVKAKITAYDALYSLYEDAGTYLELAADADDGSLDEEIGETFRNLEKTVEKLRLETLLSGEYDMNNAILNFHAGAWVTVPIWRCMLNYLSKDCLRGGRNESTLSWSISAESFRTSDARVLGPDVKASLIIKSLDRYIANWRQSI